MITPRRLFNRMRGVSLIVFVIIAVSSHSAMTTTIRDVDTNQDGVIDFSDFIYLASIWGRTVKESSSLSWYDWDNTGQIDFGDLLILVSFYGQSYLLPMPILLLSGLSDTLNVGQTDTLIITVNKNSIPLRCDVFGIGIGGVPFEPTDIKYGVDSIIFTSRITLNEPGDFFVIVQVDFCGPSARDSVRVVGIGIP